MVDVIYLQVYFQVKYLNLLMWMIMVEDVECMWCIIMY